MFNKHAFQIKMVKDVPANKTTVNDVIRPSTPEEIEQISKAVLRQIAINVGAVIVVKITVAVALNLIAKKLGS